MQLIALTYLSTGSPAVATHVIMHMAAVLHGMETTLQVPPHYRWRPAGPQRRYLTII
jgi:hypothetical protein